MKEGDIVVLKADAEKTDAGNRSRIKECFPAMLCARAYKRPNDWVAESLNSNKRIICPEDVLEVVNVQEKII